MDERGTRTLTESLSAAIEAAMLEVRTCTPARVTAYDAAEQKAEVLPLLKRKTAAGEVISPKPIGNVPVLQLRAGGFSVTLPVASGDVGLLLCSDRSLDLWLESGGQTDPQSRRHHQLTDAVFLPGLRHWDGVPSAVAGTTPGSDLVISAEDGDSFVTLTAGGDVKIKGSTVKLGNPTATAALALATLTDARVTALQAKLDSLIGNYDIHTHALAGGVGAASPPIPLETVLGVQASVAASKVFGE